MAIFFLQCETESIFLVVAHPCCLLKVYGEEFVSIKIINVSIALPIAYHVGSAQRNTVLGCTV